VSYHEHNEAVRTGELVKRLEAGASVAWFPTPGRLWCPIPVPPGPGSDRSRGDGYPDSGIIGGHHRTQRGPGFLPMRFAFCGFLPAKSSQRRKLLEQFKMDHCTLVFYETPHRILDALEDVEAVMGTGRRGRARADQTPRRVSARNRTGDSRRIGREAIGERRVYAATGKAGRDARNGDAPVEEAVREAESLGLSRMDAIKHVARQRGLNKRDVYRKLTE